MSREKGTKTRSAQAALRSVKADKSGPKGRAVESKRRVVEAAADMTSCEQIRQLFIRCRRSIRDGSGCMTINLENVRQADTKLVACLVAVYQLAQKSSVRMELTASRAVLDMVELYRLGSLMERTAPRP